MIWRRFKCRSNIGLSDLHHVIQIIMGWYDCHLHEFIVGKNSYGIILPDEDNRNIQDENKFKISDIITEKNPELKYWYDFGDDWYHSLKLEKTIQNPDNFSKPVCLEGDLNCPPEDAGGIHGYYEKLKVLKGKKNQYYKEIKEWMGDYNPNDFDMEKINNLLKKHI